MLDRECRRCGKLVTITRTGHTRAHDCPHGEACVLPVRERFAGARPGRCSQCFASRQLALPFQVDA